MPVLYYSVLCFWSHVQFTSAH